MVTVPLPDQVSRVGAAVSEDISMACGTGLAMAATRVQHDDEQSFILW